MLISLTFQLERRVDALAAEMAPLLTTHSFAAEWRRAEHITFQLQNAWEIYVRNFILLSATGRATTVSGPLPPSVPASYRSREAACHYLLALSPDRFEPKWYQPKAAIKAAKNLQIPNYSNVSAAIGSTPWVLDELRLVRNFFAHRSRSSAVALRALGWFAPSEAISVENTLVPYVPGGARRFEFWCANMKAISKSML